MGRTLVLAHYASLLQPQRRWVLGRKFERAEESSQISKTPPAGYSRRVIPLVCIHRCASSLDMDGGSRPLP